MTIPRPSNFPAVYMLDCPISCSPFLTYQICRLPPPRSDPVARKSTSSFHAACSKTLSVHIDPLWFAPYGCVRITLFDKVSGIEGIPAKCQCGMCPGVSVSLGRSDIELIHRVAGITHFPWVCPKLCGALMYAACAEARNRDARGIWKCMVK